MTALVPNKLAVKVSRTSPSTRLREVKLPTLKADRITRLFSTAANVA
ncbi:MAG: hypothetical protein M5U15_14995 [Kiritimatiellae bacterium]|nr:hypothetical protein [Kiritimatiellia bacterium]